MEQKNRETARRIRTRLASLALCLSLPLSACGGAKTPVKTVDGMPWNSEWVTIGTMLGVEVPEGYTEQRSEGIVTGAQTYYTVWSKGDAITYIDSEQNEITTYESQIYLLAEENKTAEEAVAAAGSWQELSDERYTYTDTYTGSYGGQEFDVVVFPFPEDGGPLSKGASATAVRGAWAIHVDVRTADGESPEKILDDFLGRLHYAL